MIEPKTGSTEVVLNEKASSKVSAIVQGLKDFVGDYQIYSATKKGAQFTTDAQMTKLAIQKFKNHKAILSDALSSEDFEDTGVAELL